MSHVHKYQEILFQNNDIFWIFKKFYFINHLDVSVFQASVVKPWFFF